ncbi:conserved hypothetical protein [Trichinella spiralis]|uniref:hypothetical protein n=1 Tax=Trichinella spiralis TaxID=6334 RepID=UPI0001EFB4FE|nr:conserved hypothetical protein [Trichinella spiralis]
MHVRLHDFRLHKRADQCVDVEQHALRLYHDIFMRQGESNSMSSARQAIWLTTVLHAAQWAELHMRPVVKEFLFNLLVKRRYPSHTVSILEQNVWRGAPVLDELLIPLWIAR